MIAQSFAHLSLVVMALLVVIDHVSGDAERIHCGDVVEGTYSDEEIRYKLKVPDEKTVVIRTCGASLTDWDTKLKASERDGPNTYINDDMGAACPDNEDASQIAWVTTARTKYKVKFDAGSDHSYAGDEDFKFEVICSSTVSRSPGLRALFAKLAPEIDTTLLSCVEGVYYYDGLSTCVACGKHDSPCPSEIMFCAGGDTCGFGSKQVEAVADALDNGGTHPLVPNCPAIIECEEDEFKCKNGICLSDYAALCNCEDDCGDGSDEDPEMCKYEELTCNGPHRNCTLYPDSRHGYYFTLTKEQVATPRTCHRLTDADTCICLYDDTWDRIDGNDDCGPVLCPSNEFASGLSQTLEAGDYRVCVKPGAKWEDGDEAEFAVELRCTNRINNYWKKVAGKCGIMHELLECQQPESTWVYDGIDSCVGCGGYKKPCDENDDEIYCAGGTKMGYGSKQLRAVKDAIANGGQYPGTTCAD